MITIIDMYGNYSQVSNALVWTIISVSIAIVLGFYLLRSFAIYTMAKNRNFKNLYLAFIPCVWIYLACKLIGNVKTFGWTFSKLALAFTIIFSVGEVLNFIYQFLVYFPVAGNFLAGKELYLVMVSEAGYTSSEWSGVANGLYISDYANPYVNMGIENAINIIVTIISYISIFTDVAILVISILVYINLFRRYIPNHYIVFTVLSVFGLFAPLLFAVRKKEAIDFNDYLKARYNMWYSNGNPYGGQVNNGAPQTPSTPFEEFADKDEIDPGDPFADLSNKSNSEDDNDDFFN